MTAVPAAITTGGFSVRWDEIDEHKEMLAGTNANAARLFMCWKYLQHRGRPSPVDLSLTVDQAEARGAELTDAFLARPELQAGLNHTAWQLSILRSFGLATFLSIGDGGANCLGDVVDVANSSGTTLALDPNIVGPEAYLAHTYILTRALVRRYGLGAAAVQLGNELNYCWVAALGGEFHWAAQAGSTAGTSSLRHGAAGLAQLRALRDAAPARPKGGRDGTSWLVGLIGQWGNATFMDRVVSVLRAAVRAENASIPTSVNYMVDVPEGFSQLAEMPHWTELAAREPWASASDILAVDTYPNFVFAQPPRADVVAQRVAEAVALAGGRPVWIAETGIGVLGAGVAAGGPETDFSEENQAEYYAASYDQAARAGATGFFAFGWWRDPGIGAPPGGFSAEDAEALSDVAALYLNGTDAIPALVDFGLSHLDYAVTRLPGLVVNVSTHFGVFAESGVPRAAARALSSRFPNAPARL